MPAWLRSGLGLRGRGRRGAAGRSGVRARAVTVEDGVTVVDVRGLTCPGYLLAINEAVAGLAPGTRARLLTSYPPCGEDVAAWCRARGVALLGVAHGPDGWAIEIRR